MLDISFFKFPLSLIFAATFAVCCISVLKFLGDTNWCRVLRGKGFASAVAVCAMVLLCVGGTFAIDIQHTAGFIVLCLLILFSLFCAICADWRNRRPRGQLLGHAGLFLVIFATLFGAPDYEEGLMHLSKGKEENIAISGKGRSVALPFTVILDDFEIDYYEDGHSPRQFKSYILVDGIPKTTSVNHPCFHKGWFLYQNSYNKEDLSTTVLKAVRDPSLPVVFLGMAVLALGAVLSIKNVWKSRQVLAGAIVLAAVFTVISLARIKFQTLMPALRSLWFVPHLMAYMLAYSFLALALIFGAKWPLSRRLLQTSSSLLVLGMLCGAVWAKFAWGDYWTWDPKESWAAGTWLLTLSAIHISGQKKKLALALILLSFLAMQITWYGVNYLPSASASVHTYNQ